MGLKIRIDPLDVLFSKYIRLRAKGRCERCGSEKGIKGLQCAHYHSRRKGSVRWDEDNAVALCFGCHQHFHEEHHEFDEFMKQRLGDRLDLLDARARVPARHIDKAMIKIWLEQEIKKYDGDSLPNR
jgi:5-methylcytosine-specific restriction endonuclease McrA